MTRRQKLLIGLGVTAVLLITLVVSVIAAGIWRTTRTPEPVKADQAGFCAVARQTNGTRLLALGFAPAALNTAADGYLNMVPSRSPVRADVVTITRALKTGARDPSVLAAAGRVDSYIATTCGVPR